MMKQKRKCISLVMILTAVWSLAACIAPAQEKKPAGGAGRKKAPIKGKWPNVTKRRGTYFQAAWDPGSSKIVACLRNRTWLLDPESWALTDHKASPSPAANPRDMLKESELRWYTGDHTYLIWGSLCVDPVNNEVLLLGGDSSAPEGTPGFWRYSFEKNAWTKNPALAEAEAKRAQDLESLADEAWTLLSRARNRFHVAETGEETKAELASAAEKLVKAIDRLRTAEKDQRVAQASLQRRPMRCARPFPRWGKRRLFEMAGDIDEAGD